VYTARLALPAGRYDDATAAGFYAALVDRLGGEPGISSASVANCAPGEGRCRQSTVMSIDGRAIEPPGQPAVGVHFATANHFATIGATVQRGRTFADDDRAGAPLVAVITAPLAARLWPGSDAIGRRLQIYSASGSLDGDRMVIGVLEPIAFDLERDRGLDVFLPAAQQAWTSASVFAAGTIDSRRFARSLAAAVASIDRSVAIADAGGLDAPLQRSLGIESFLRQSLLFFGTAGLLLAAAGALATTAQAAARRRREAAVRLALGATPLQVLWLTARRGIAVAAIGAAAGLAGAAGTAGSLRALLHGLSPHDPLALMAGPAITFVALAAAVAWPSMTASRSDPATLLRADE
jgi:hypothetical protein